MKSLSDPACLREILDRLSLMRADSPRLWGRMNAHQMICHVADSYRAVMGRKSVSMAERKFSARLIKWVALNVPMHWPRGFPTRPEMDQEKLGTPPGDFDADLHEVILLTEEFARPPRSFTFAPHPMFFEMTEAEWMRWGYLHVDHHLRQFGR